MKSFTFIDLFAGIGGFHLALHSLGGKCVFASEIDAFARQTYMHNFKGVSPELFDNKFFNEDIRSMSPYEIPDFDILCAGFPCQPFSQAGHKRGFNDTHKSERGNLFFNIVEILEVKKPKAFFLENVRGIINHDTGNTFRTIRKILEEELGYSFYFQVVKASDYGLPQHRPRVFIIGFRDEGFLKSFNFPQKIPLKFNMSDVWNAECSREIGFTLRVGGRGSDINDRRNWDSYLVDGHVQKLMPLQARKMQGFPDDFEFPVSNTEAMKQLGNSVAIDAVRECAKALVAQVSFLESNNKQMGSQMDNQTKNKGEWTELYTFIKLINEKKLMLADKNLDTLDAKNYFNVSKVSTLNIAESCYLDSSDTILIKNEQTGASHTVQVSEFVNDDTLKDLLESIKTGKKTFSIPLFNIIQNALGISIINGGNSNQKSDIILDITNKDFSKNNEGFGIKSYLGSKPTLLNASGNTNFIFQVYGFPYEKIDEVNVINTKHKLKDRIEKIYELGGSLVFHRIEKENMDYNLRLIDSIMPKLLSEMLLEFYVYRNNKIKPNLSKVYRDDRLVKTHEYDFNFYEVKIKRFLVAVLLGLFAGSKWDGKYVSNGIIIVKENGSQVGFHITELDVLENFLFENIKFDTPSTSRHRYGSLIAERSDELYFKLNLQLRF